MFSISFSVLKNENGCYDMIPSVLLRLYMLEEKRFPSDHELGWLKTAVKNEALMWLRREIHRTPE